MLVECPKLEESDLVFLDHRTVPEFVRSKNLKISSKYDPTVQWVTASGSPIKSNSNSSMILGFHSFKSLHGKQTEDHSTYGTSGPDSESEDRSEDEFDEKDLALNCHCLVLICGVLSPIWFQWKSDTRLEAQIEIAAHPTEPIAAWSHSAFELQIADLRSGKLKSVILPKPVDIQVHTASATRKGKSHKNPLVLNTKTSTTRNALFTQRQYCLLPSCLIH